MTSRPELHKAVRIHLPQSVRIYEQAARISASMATLGDGCQGLLGREPARRQVPERIHPHRSMAGRMKASGRGPYSVVVAAVRPATPARGVEEETGRRPGRLEHRLTFPPPVGSSDAAPAPVSASSAEPTGSRLEVNQADEIRRVPISGAHSTVETGEIAGWASSIGLLELIAQKGGARTPC